jgi:hypothetical protein
MRTRLTSQRKPIEKDGDSLSQRAKNREDLTQPSRDVFLANVKQKSVYLAIACLEADGGI